MKIIVASLSLLLSLSASADESVLSAMKSIFRGGNYIGISRLGGCVLSIQYYPDRAVVTATAGNTSVTRMIMDGTGYRFNVGTRELLSSDQSGTFRSIAVDQSATYTVTAEANSFGRETAVECVIR
jgi:hypothetical protein